MRDPFSFAAHLRPGGTPAVGRTRIPPAWLLLLAVVPLLAGSYLLLPAAGSARVAAYPIFGLVAMVIVLAVAQWKRPARAGSWRLIALALALLSTGDIAYTVLSIGGGGVVSYPSVSDVAYLGGYGALILGVVGLFRGRLAGGDRTAFIDAATLAVGAGSLSWIAIIRPNLDGSQDPIAGLVSMAYPVFDLVLLTLCLRVLLTAATRPRFFHYLVAGISLYLVADVVYAMAVLQGTYAEGNPVDIGWIAGVLLFAVAALHPSAAQEVATVDTNEAKLSAVRLGMLATAALIAPTILLVSEVQSGDELVIGLVIQWTVLFGLVFLRLATTVKALAASLQERRNLQDNLAYEATHDSLTRLANRSLFQTRLATAMQTAPARTGLVFLDIDDFKDVNDTLGHPTGDDVLRITAGRVERQLRGSDLAARVGGDELAILVENCDDINAVQSVAERALSAVRAPLEVAGHHLLIHASAGVSLGSGTATAVSLMRDADIAMYQAKSHGKDRAESFQSAMLGELLGPKQLPVEPVAPGRRRPAAST